MPEEEASASPKKSDNNLLAAISYLWILSVIILFVKKDDDYVTFHAKQGTVLFAVSVVLWILGLILFFLLPLLGILNLAVLVAVIVGFIQALSGKRYKMPVVGDLAEKINL